MERKLAISVQLRLKHKDWKPIIIESFAAKPDGFIPYVSALKGLTNYMEGRQSMFIHNNLGHTKYIRI